MKNNTIDKNNVFYSVISGYDFYYSQNYVDNNEEISAVHNLTSENVRFKKCTKNMNLKEIERVKDLILYPVISENAIWPIDLVQDSKKNYWLVFSDKSYQGLIPLQNMFIKGAKKNWKNPKTRKLVANILDLFTAFIDSDYGYHCFDLKKIYYNQEDMSVIADFSLNTNKYYGDARSTCFVDISDLGIECFPLWYKFDKNAVIKMDLIDDMFSIATLIFKLLIGRMPYQGRNMDDYGSFMHPNVDANKREAEIMFTCYRKPANFIFDPVNTDNAIGLTTTEQKVNELWDKLPKRLKDMFVDVFEKSNSQNKNNMTKVYTPAQWKEALEMIDGEGL